MSRGSIRNNPLEKEDVRTGHLGRENPGCDVVDADVHTRTTQLLGEEGGEVDSSAFGDVVLEMML